MADHAFDDAVGAGGALLFRLVRSVSAVESSEIRCCGVTTGQCLALLAMKPECCPDDRRQRHATMRQMTTALGVSPGTATRVIDNLVRDGLVERCDSPDDRRHVCVRPTAEGHKVIEALEGCYERYCTTVFEAVPRERLGGVLAALDVLVDAVEAASATCTAPAVERDTQAKMEDGGTRMKQLRNPAAGSDGSSCCASAPAECCPDVSTESTKEAVRQTYANLITRRREASCCEPEASLGQCNGYTAEQLEKVPEGMQGTAFGCGNPVAFAGVREGEVVLDIGSGAGLDALLAAERVGPEGKVIGLDMTPEMIEAATANARRAGATNVEFRLGDAEAMPVEDATCDWIVSNCVINLAPDKGKVFAEAYRVLRPGGRLMVSDIVTHSLPDAFRQNMGFWSGCIGGALEEEEYLEAIRGAGFEDVQVEHKVTYDESAMRGMVKGCCGPDGAEEMAAELAGRASSVRVSAVKPQPKE